jgi:hypothetical protein
VKHYITISDAEWEEMKLVRPDITPGMFKQVILAMMRGEILVKRAADKGRPMFTVKLDA